MKRLLIAFVLADFVALEFYVLAQVGYTGFVQAVLANTATVTAFADLVIALSLITVWMVRDARRRGVGIVPYLAVTAVLGSAGPLLYLLLHGEESVPTYTATPARAAGGEHAQSVVA